MDTFTESARRFIAKAKQLGPAERYRRYRSVFGSEEGRWVLHDLCKNGFVFKPTFVAGDPRQSDLNEGTRRLVLSILKYSQISETEIIDNYEQINATQ